MRDLESDIACAAEWDAPLMISGERGTGKAFVAEQIHRRGLRANGPFIVASCPDGQFERDLWKTADNGTLLIEDIQRIPMQAQSHLPRFIGSEMTRAGSDARLMTATTVDLFERVRANRFPDDLFYHLNVIHLVIPPLRDRPEDIPILFRHYLSVYARAEAPRLSTAAWDRLAAYRWPGNVQELKAVAQEVAVREMPRLVQPDDLPAFTGE